MNRPLIATLCAALAFSAASVPAHANQIEVAYADLNLATPEGQQSLERRIDRAAKKVCGFSELASTDLSMRNQIMSCYQQARKDAAVQMASLVEDFRYGG